MPTMHPHVAAALWFCVLVLAPGVAQAVTFRSLRRERIGLAPGDRMHPRVWRWADADARNYTGRGRAVLRVHKLLQAAQMLGFVTWGARVLF